VVVRAQRWGADRNGVVDEVRALGLPVFVKPARGGSSIGITRVTDLADLVRPGDALVLNETRVFPARLTGTRPGGGAAEVFLLHPSGEAEDLWVALVRPGGKMRAGRELEISPDLSVRIEDVLPGGERLVRLLSPLGVDAALDRSGEVPLPPYVRRDATAEDRERYQTVYARERGSVAAPTAGLHFTPSLLAALDERGVEIARLTLHVGVGTFRPVEAEDPAEHRMHREWYRVPPESAQRINAVRARGGAVWGVGTTTVRTLETVADPDGAVHPGEGWTDIFIRPPYRLRAIDRLITNFHLPRSTLLMLVASFAGYDLTMRAYRTAVERGYRFYSYGDAMAII
ncbi:MAG: tRNA preQ1(34) S-adenosylmethionine ribosyltransferase-isomerase QueA, partial [Gemmatimonadetes bacterium]|nr:tRNA preQ1(34) S-adenosylmethionine ribosyltransferase-isomerase QueA [Gemmatimonadota bacterium]